MIGKLTGTLDSVTPTQAIIDVQGVGYVVACSARTMRQLGTPGSAVSLLVETHVREDAISLFGFVEATERDWFRLLTTVQGVGAKVALAILGSLSPEQIAAAIAAQDKSALTQADGVGPKLAARLITELRDKVSELGAAQPIMLAELRAAAGAPDLSTDALSALINLGYRRAEAFAAVATARGKLGQQAKLDDIIRTSLAELSRREHAA